MWRPGSPHMHRCVWRTQVWAPVCEGRAHAGEKQMARSLTQRMAAQASKGVAAQAPQAPEGA